MRLIRFVILVCIALGFSSCDAFLQGLADAYEYNQRMQMMYMFGPGIVTPAPAYVPPPIPSVSTGTYVPPVSSGNYSSSSSEGSSSSSSYSGSGYSRDCGVCLGTGKCNTCNGRGYYDVIGLGSGRHLCPNCASNHNGVCASCNGTGKR